MAKRKHKIRYEPEINEIIQDNFEPSVRDYGNSHSRIVTIPSPGSHNISANTASRTIEIEYDDDEQLSTYELDNLIVQSLEEESSRKLNRITPYKGVRDKTKCERAKSARRAAAFRSGSAGYRRKTKPKRRYKCNG